MAVVANFGSSNSAQSLSTSRLSAEASGFDVAQKEIRLVESGGEKVIFTATPELEESGTTLYIETSEGRMPSSLLIYMGSPSRNFNISAKLISRTTAEATTNFKYKALLQAWRMPLDAFGDGGIAGDDSGQTPRIIRLSGYGKQFMAIPTVVKSVNFTWPSDVDYIADISGNMVPIIWPVSVSLQEVHTIEDVKAFKYGDYKLGNLEEWS